MGKNTWGVLSNYVKKKKINRNLYWMFSETEGISVKHCVDDYFNDCLECWLLQHQYHNQYKNWEEETSKSYVYVDINIPNKSLNINY